MKAVKLHNVQLKEIIYELKNGGLIIMPTETLYGAMVDATNQEAVNKLSKYKNRPFGKPFSIAVSDINMAEKYVNINSTARKLFNKFLPGPLTIVCRGKHKVARGVESENGTLGIRIPKYNLILKVVQQLDKPITATSANASYKKRPYQVSDILENISQKQKQLIDLIIDAGALPHNEPSTVIDTTMDDPVVLRQGKIKLKDKNEVLSVSPESTQNFAKELWQKYEKFYGQRAIVFALEGLMGTGKTQFTKGLAKAMGLKDKVLSPTYILEEEYGGGKLHHIDAWRMISSNELNNLGFQRIITDKSVVAIEWADKVVTEIRKYREEAIIVWVELKYRKKENERIINWGII